MFRSEFYSYAILLTASLLLIILLNYWHQLRRRFVNSGNFDLVMYITTYKVSMYFFFPSILRLISDFSYDRLIGAEPSEILDVYLIEFISYISWLLAIAILLKFLNYDHRFDNGNIKYVNMIDTNRASLLMMSIICILYIIFFPYSLEQRVEINLGQALLIQPILMLIGPIVGVYLLAVTNNLFIGFFLAMPVVILAIFGAFSGGSRGQIMSLLLWFLFIYLFVKRKTWLIIASVLCVLILAFAGTVMTQVRGEDEFAKRAFSENIFAMYAGVISSTSDGGILDSMEFRFGEGGRKSVGFLRLVEDGNNAGLNIIETALWSFLPRKYFPEKPLLGSIDGTREGMGMHIIHIVMEGRAYIMSEFYTGLHAYWELNMYGVVVFSMISGFFIAGCIIYFRFLGIFGLSLMMVTLKPPWLEPKLWLSELLADAFHTIVPLIIFWIMVKVGLSLFDRKFLKTQPKD